MLLRTNGNAAMADLVLYPDGKPLRRCDVDPNVLTTETGDLQDGIEIRWIDEGVQFRQAIVPRGFINLFPFLSDFSPFFHRVFITGNNNYSFQSPSFKIFKRYCFVSAAGKNRTYLASYLHRKFQTIEGVHYTLYQHPHKHHIL